MRGIAERAAQIEQKYPFEDFISELDLTGFVEDNVRGETIADGDFGVFSETVISDELDYVRNQVEPVEVVATRWKKDPAFANVQHNIDKLLAQTRIIRERPVHMARNRAAGWAANSIYSGLPANGELLGVLSILAFHFREGNYNGFFKSDVSEVLTDWRKRRGDINPGFYFSKEYSDFLNNPYNREQSFRRLCKRGIFEWRPVYGRGGYCRNKESSPSHYAYRFNSNALNGVVGLGLLPI